jgi:hypothetical protein
MRILSVALLFALAACGAATPPPRAAVGPPVPQRAGLDRVIGQDARALQMLFGVPDLDVRENMARKLQFAGPVCVLDTYLYPPATGREPVVRHIDARTPAGDDFDGASCIAALSRRVQAR